MDVKKITKILIVLMVVIVGGYDIYALIQGGSDATISHVTLSWAKDYPIIPFSAGVICGHLFWPQYKKEV